MRFIGRFAMKNNISTFYNASTVQTLEKGLREYMVKVFSHMSIGLAITTLVAFFSIQSGALANFLNKSPYILLGLAVAELCVVFYLSSKIDTLSSGAARLWFYVYSFLSGITISPLVSLYTGESVVTAFLTTSVMFLSMAIYGYVTKKDLTNFGSFLLMGLIGIIVATVCNFFIGSTRMAFIISIIAVALFTGLTAYDTQLIKSLYFEDDGEETVNKKSIIGALRLYLDFINMFIYLLRFVGNRRD